MTAAGFPTLLAQIAFTTPYTTGTPTWVAVTDYVQSFNTRFGRPSPLTSVEPGTAEARLRNTDNRFSPDNASGPYYGYLRPMRQMRFVAQPSGGTARPLFTGYTDRFGPRTLADGSTSVTATDRFKMLAKRTSTISRPDEDVDDRITAILENGGGADIIVSSTYREINTDALPARDVATYDYEGFQTLQALQDLALADGGQLFVNGSNVLVYQTVKYREAGGATRALTSQARLGNDATSIPIEPDVQPQVDQNLMANRVMVTDCNGEVKTAEDTTYHDDDGVLELDIGGTLLLATDAQDRVNDLLAARKNPTERYERITVDLMACSAAEQETVLGLTMSDRVTVALINPNTGTGTARDQWIEGIEHDVQITGDPRWMVSFNLSSAGGSVTALP